MADKRPAFRFRLPWFPAAQAPRPTTAPGRPSQPPISATPLPTTPQIAETQAPPQPTTRQTAEIQTPTPPTTPTPTTQPTTPTPTTRQTAEIQAPTPTTRQTAEIQAPTQPTTPTPTTRQTAEIQAPTRPTLTTPRTRPTTPTLPTRQTAEIQAPTQPTPTTRQTAETQAATQPATPTPETSEAAETQAPTQSTATIAPAQTTTQAAETQTPSQPNVAAETQTPTQPSITTSTPTNAEEPSFGPPGPAPAETPQPQSSRTESQPTSLSRETTQPQAPPPPASPSRATTHSRAPSQPSTPSRAASSPSRTAAQRQPTTEYLTQTASPPNGEQDKEEPELTSSDQLSLELHPKPKHVSGTIYESQNQKPVETSTEQNKIALQPSKESDTRTFTPTGGPETAEPTKKSDASTVNDEPESSLEDSKPQETKEVKEVMQESKDKKHEEVEHKDDFLLRGEQGSAVQTKAQPTIAFQSDQAQKTPGTTEMTETSAPNGKETKRIAQPRIKSMVDDSSRKLDMSNRESIPLHKEIRNDISKLVHMMAVGDPKHSIDDRPVSVITLAGENRGVSMQLGSGSLKKGGIVHIHRGYKKNPDESDEITTDGEGSTKGKTEGMKSIEDQATEAYVNSNIQGINNSIVFSSSITERNPGVQLIYSHLPAEAKESTGRADNLDSNKITNAQKLTHQPMVRRRCLRGLFLESSDSDPDNNAKPRRHGCRVVCKDKYKENKTDVL